MSAQGVGFFQLRQLCGYVAASTWVVMVWDNVTTMDDEVGFVWRMAWTAHLKWLYLFARYGSLALQTAVFVLQACYLSDHNVSLHHCRIYRFSEMVMSGLLMLCFDVVLLLRVYALYGWRTWSSAFATTGVTIEFGMCLFSASTTVPTAMYDAGCALATVPKSILYFIVGTFVSQSILVWLAFRKREHITRVRSSIACITIRDGLVVFLSVAVFLVITLYWTLRDSTVTTLMIFPIPVVTSIATSRVVLNLRPVDHTQFSEELTTDILGMYGDGDSFLLSDGPFQRRA